MSDRMYRFFLGLILLACLYLDLYNVILIVILIELFEGLTNLRVPLLINKCLACANLPNISSNHKVRISFDAERAWRLVVAVFLFLSAVLFTEQLWWLIWFMAFAILGAGLSGICPMLMSLRFVGFR